MQYLFKIKRIDILTNSRTHDYFITIYNKINKFQLDVFLVSRRIFPTDTKIKSREKYHMNIRILLTPLSYISISCLSIFLLVSKQKSQIFDGVPREALTVQVPHRLRLLVLSPHRRSRDFFSRFPHRFVLLLASISLDRSISRRRFLLRPNLRPSDVVYHLQRWLWRKVSGRGDP